MVKNFCLYIKHEMLQKRSFAESKNMKLTIKRNQADVKGLFGGHKGVKFSLYGRCEVNEAEKAVIAKYKVGSYVLATYQIQHKGAEPIDFRITVDGIIAGETVETDDINTLLELESSMKQGCRNMLKLLAVMGTFGGEESFEIDIE
jgi:hypothetical protein